MVQSASANSTTAGCPDRRALSDLVLGKLPLDALDRLEAHLATCANCQSILDTLEGAEDSIIAELRGATSASSLTAPELEARMQQAEELLRDVHRSESQASMPPPETLGPYQLLHPLGAGGMGTVWKAVHAHLKRPVALKILRTVRHQSPDARARFYREMEAVGRLDHPNLVRAYDAGIVDDRDYLAMELLNGVDGRQLLQQNGPLSVANACEITRQAAVALQYVHEQSLVHRDIKPANLMLTPAGQVKLLDLGLARFHDVSPNTEDVAEGRKIVGTANFIAPEQIEDSEQADARADIYSLGCTLYNLLAGRPPYSGPSCDTVGKKLYAQSRLPMPRICETRSDIPLDLGRLLDRMTAKSPGDRPASAKDVANELVQFCHDADLAGLNERSPRPRSRSQSKPKRIWPWLACLIAVTCLAWTAWNGEIIVLWMQGDGLLIAQGPDATVVLVGDHTNQEIQVPTEETGLRISAGKYEVRLAGESNAELSAAPTSITVHRGGKASIQIHRAGSPSESPSQKLAASPLPDQFNNSIGMSFRLIPAGEFLMGSLEPEKEREWSESPQHRVIISRPFYFGEFEVTQAEYERVVGHNPSRFSDTGEFAGALKDVDTNQLPVESIRWPDAVEFCRRLSSLPAEQKAGRSYRLPTEAEWEYACRAGTTSPFHHGDMLAPGDANFKSNFPYGDFAPVPFLGRTMPVGSFAANAWGLHDMHGNVWEWTSDRFEFGYYHRAPQADPTGPESGEFHVMRGGGWGVRGSWCRSAFRCSEEIAPKVFYSIGFRVVCDGGTANSFSIKSADWQ